MNNRSGVPFIQNMGAVILYIVENDQSFALNTTACSSANAAVDLTFHDRRKLRQCLIKKFDFSIVKFILHVNRIADVCNDVHGFKFIGSSVPVEKCTVSVIKTISIFKSFQKI